MEKCVFTEADRTGGRSKIKTNENGFPGMQCKHCCGKAGYGRYFPASITSLNLANSDRNMYNHLMKCRKCPVDLKDKLQRLQNQKRHGRQKIERGGRKIFFKRIWERLHGHESCSSSSSSAVATTQIKCTGFGSQSQDVTDYKKNHDTYTTLKNDEVREPTFLVAI